MASSAPRLRRAPCQTATYLCCVSGGDGQVAIAPHLYKKLPHDPVSSRITGRWRLRSPCRCSYRYAIAARGKRQGNSFALAKSTPGRLTSSSGKERIDPPFGRDAQLMAGIDIVHANAHKGAALPITAVMVARCRSRSTASRAPCPTSRGTAQGAGHFDQAPVVDRAEHSDYR